MDEMYIFRKPCQAARIPRTVEPMPVMLSTNRKYVEDATPLREGGAISMEYVRMVENSVP